jgi:hypothetical protein
MTITVTQLKRLEGQLLLRRETGEDNPRGGNTMTGVLNSKIEGEFNGYNDGAVFRLANGQVCQQKRYKYKYKYKYRLSVQIAHNGTEYMMHVDCMSEPIAVVRVSIAEEGTIVSNFAGFSQDARFQFQNGRIWVPAEYKYSYHYAHRPEAVVVDGIDGYELSVEGMSETLRVRRAN